MIFYLIRLIRVRKSSTNFQQFKASNGGKNVYVCASFSREIKASTAEFLRSLLTSNEVFISANQRKYFGDDFRKNISLYKHCKKPVMSFVWPVLFASLMEDFAFNIERWSSIRRFFASFINFLTFCLFSAILTRISGLVWFSCSLLARLIILSAAWSRSRSQRRWKKLLCVLSTSCVRLQWPWRGSSSTRAKQNSLRRHCIRSRIEDVYLFV